MTKRSVVLLEIVYVFMMTGCGNSNEQDTGKAAPVSKDRGVMRCLS